jgi:hypothetical protein
VVEGLQLWDCSVWKRLWDCGWKDKAKCGGVFDVRVLEVAIPGT